MRIFLSLLGAFILIGTLLVGVYAIQANLRWGDKRIEHKQPESDGDME